MSTPTIAEAPQRRQPQPTAAPARLDVQSLRADFPILGRSVRGKPLVYLDNAATTQKPTAVLEAMQRFYVEECSNVHRGVHLLSELATRAYESARWKVQRYLGAAEAREIVFVRGATEAINLVANTYGRKALAAGDEVLVTHLEHHSNIVPWQIVCAERGAQLRVVPINDAGEVLLDEFDRLLGDRTKIVAVAHVSNALGTVNPVREMIRRAHGVGAVVLVDGAQAAPHIPIDVRSLDCDFYAFSGHKLYGPMGIGVLYGKSELLEAIPPYQGGGEMIRSVTFAKTEYNELPHKFEAGTPNVAGAVGLAAGIDYLERIGLEAIANYEHSLLEYATERLLGIEGLRIVGTAARKAAVISYEIDGIHPHDIGTILDQQGIAIRTGHHCAQPVMDRFGVPATARASLAFYNTFAEIDALVEANRAVKEVFG